ncbi:alpha/beta fold hydrolase [Sphingomonas sp. ID0503]|uniref:alpha/beta fold hydrolase n=1 Tax=Sphingomonas sp. ID0503 TaxID=3399691 RepID=UPI003AFA6454
MTNPEIGKSIVANGIRTNYIEEGEGPPLILIHGSGPGVTGFANWRGVIPDLARHFRVIAPDMVGFGYTDCPADIKDFTLDVWVAHIIGLLDALGIEKASFIGNSYGGALSLATAARHPNRVDKFVLMGAAGLDFKMTEGLERVWNYEPTLENMRALMTTFAYNADLVTDVIVQSRHEASLRPEGRAAYERLFPEPRQEKLSRLATPEDDIRRIEHKAMIVHGREDVIVPVENAYRFSSLLKHSELHVFGECGHWTQIEKRDRFVELVTPFLLG